LRSFWALLTNFSASSALLVAFPPIDGADLPSAIAADDGEPISAIAAVALAF
jgi:hypothetical protein